MIRGQFERFLGVDLGGGKGKKTAVAVLDRQDTGIAVVALLPRSGDPPLYDTALIDELRSRSAGALLCRRFNLLPDRAALADPGYEFYRNVLKVVRPREDSGERFPRHATLDTEFPFTLLGVQGKVLCRLRGRKWIGYGNHTVRHRGALVPADGIEVYHYPIRTFAEFERKVINHGTSLANNRGIPPHTGWHVRRWYELHRRGWLREEYERLVPSSDAVRRWIEEGTIEEDRLVCDLFESEAFDDVGRQAR